MTFEEAKTISVKHKLFIGHHTIKRPVLVCENGPHTSFIDVFGISADYTTMLRATALNGWFIAIDDFAEAKTLYEAMCD